MIRPRRVRCLCLIGVATLTACSVRERPRTEDEEKATLGQQVGFAIPSGTRLLGVERESRRDDMVRFKVAIPRQLWPSVERTLPIRVNEMHRGHPGVVIDGALVSDGGGLGPDHGWWDPGNVRNFVTGYMDRGGGRFLRIGVDDSQPAVVILYVLEHGT